jgi:short-subunit dehydrogenase
VSTLAVCPGPTSSEFFRRAGLAENAVADALGETCEQVVMASLKAIASGKAMVISGWKNKLAAAFVTKLPKPLAARLTALVMARYRLSRVTP